jgi:3-deoxy-D-manno-octulosonate 8-phosphate phosphatase (KDO 8-P phosphatase)
VDAALLQRARAVRLALFDVDGVLTDGRLWYGPEGETLKVFHTLDGHGLKMLAASGVATGLLSGRASPAVSHRARELGIAHALLGVGEKSGPYEALLATLGLEDAQVAFMGDDLPDLPVLRRCGLAVAVPGAVPAVKAAAHHVTTAPGGGGAVREVCELLMRAQGTLDAALGRFGT